LRSGIGRTEVIAAIVLIAVVAGAVLITAGNENISERSDGVFSGGGTGTEQDPFVILTPDDLRQLKHHLDDADKFFVLGADIDLSAKPWIPIGPTPDAPDAEFSGTLDGNGHKITGMRIVGDHAAAGLFASASGATVRNLTLEVDRIDVAWTEDGGAGSAGALIGRSVVGLPCTIENVHVILKGDISARSGGNASAGCFVGGMIGLSGNGEKISNSSVTGPGKVFLDAGGADLAYVGGFAGNCLADMSYCWSDVDVEASGKSMHAGGFAGGQTRLSDHILEYCYAGGGVTVRADHADPSAVNDIHAGGFFGANVHTGYCSAEGDVTVILGGSGAGSVNAGGFAGCNIGDHSSHDVFSRGDVAVMGDASKYGAVHAGGFAGRGHQFDRSYSTGKVVGPGGCFAGGFVGVQGDGRVPNACFWDVDSSGMPSGAHGDYNRNGIIGATTAKMKTASTFTAKGWDFSGVWAVDPKGVVNDGYPYIRGLAAVITAVPDSAGYPQTAGTFEHTIGDSGIWIEGDSVLAPIGAEVMFRVKTVDGGYVHSRWSYSQDPSAGSYSAAIRVVAAPCGGTLTAHFLLKEEAALLTVASYPADAGSFAFTVDGQAGRHGFLGPVHLPKGATVRIEAAAEAGYAFAMWSGGCGTDPASNGVLLSEDKNVAALFRYADGSLNRSLTLASDPAAGGYCAFAIEMSPGVFSDLFICAGTVFMPVGTVVGASAAPTGSCKFSYWSGDLSGSRGSADPLALNENRWAAAHFTGPDGGRTLTIDVNGGSVAVTINGTTFNYTAPICIASGAAVSITSVPLSHKTFSYWSGDVQSSLNPAAFAMDGDRSVAANYADTATGRTLTIDESGGSVTVTIDGTTFDYVGPMLIRPDADVALESAVAPSGKEFSHWSGDVQSIANPVALNMDGDKSVTANYADDKTSRALTIDESGGSATATADGTAFECVGPMQVRQGAEAAAESTNAPSDKAFSHRAGGAAGSLNPIIFIMDGDGPVTANHAGEASCRTLAIDESEGSAAATIDGASVGAADS
jgi:hypothetical protein